MRQFDVEEDIDFFPMGAQKTDDIIRQNFVRKVYGILLSQLAMTTLFCLIATTSSGQQFFLSHIGLFYLMIFISLAAVIVLSCFEQIRRTVPTNYIILLLFTIGESYIIATICATYDKTSVLVAALMTTMIVGSLTIYAIVGRDFTTMGGSLLVALIGLILFGIFANIFGNEFTKMVYCTLGCILFGIYLVYDTQLILGGRSREISLDDYIMGALSLYLDIINLFLLILRMLGNKHE